MILYHLKCTCGHDFDAWFRDSATYDRQEKRGQVSCPACASTKVSKAPMAPRISTQSRDNQARESQPRDLADTIPSPEARAREIAREILVAMGKMRKHAEETCEYVGERFADEARAIHDGDAEERGIYGEATIQEAKELYEDDIPVRLLGIKGRKPS
jgi:hypothetical protein